MTASVAEVPAVGALDLLGPNRGANDLNVALNVERGTSDQPSLYAGVGGSFRNRVNEISDGGGVRCHRQGRDSGRTGSRTTHARTIRTSHDNPAPLVRSSKGTSYVMPMEEPRPGTEQPTPTPANGSGLGNLQQNCFVALDFETADQGRDSACSIALVRVEKGRIVHREHRLIRPPRRTFLFTSIHGISWSQVANAPTFGELWPELASCLDGAPFIAAHNASFDAGVMRACCDQAGLRPPSHPFVCTVQVARQAWNLRPTKLPDVCRHLGLPLQHHDALSDAEACANIVLAAISGRRSPGR